GCRIWSYVSLRDIRALHSVPASPATFLHSRAGDTSGLQLGVVLVSDFSVEARAVIAGTGSCGVSGHRGSPRRAPQASFPTFNPSRQTRSALSLSTAVTPRALRGKISHRNGAAAQVVVRGCSVDNREPDPLGPEARYCTLNFNAIGNPINARIGVGAPSAPA